MTNPNGSFLSDRQYDIAKHAVQLWIPAAATLYFTLAAIWGLPAGDAVVASATGLCVFLGVILKVSVKQYGYDGSIVVSESEGVKTYTLEVDTDLDKLPEKKNVNFQVR